MVTGALMAATVDLDTVIVTIFLYTHRMLKFYIDLDGKTIMFHKNNILNIHICLIIFE